MADRYWVGGTANWDTTIGTKWATTTGGAGGLGGGGGGSGTVAGVGGAGAVVFRFYS